MSFFITILLPALVFGLAYTLGRREWHLYRTRGQEESDLFLYTRGRLVRRLVGLGVLASLGATFASLGLAPPRTARSAAAFVALVLGEAGVLVAITLYDMWDTSRTARPGQGITHTSRAVPRTRGRARNLPPAGT